MLVKIAPMGERVIEVNVETGTSVQHILEIAGVDDDGRSVTVNNASATLDTPVSSDGAIVALAQKMKGG